MERTGFGTAARLSAGVLIAVLLVGCRTYGGHGTEEATYNQILLAVDQLEAETAEFERRVGALATVMTVDDLDRMAGSRAELVSKYRNIADRLSPSSGHRELRRILGSIITDRQILNDQVLHLEHAAARESTAPRRISDPRANYQVVPVFYHRIGATAGDATTAEVDTQAVQVEMPLENDETDEASDLEDVNGEDEDAVQ